MIREEKDGLVLYRWNIFNPWRKKFAAALTTRTGGNNQPSMDGLDSKHYINDNPEIRIKNRKHIARVLLLPDAPWIMCKQVHGTRIAALSDISPRPFRDCDGILVDRPRQICGIFLADCHPVIIYDPILHVAGIVHAGWRGTLAGIPGKLAELMVTKGSLFSNLYAAVGPGIGPCCYIVGDDVASQFRSKIKNCRDYLAREGSNHWRLDLEKVNQCTLHALGIPASRIEKGGFCTACNTEEFNSWRKECNTAGRHAALAVLY